MDRMMNRFDQQPVLAHANASGGGWGGGPPQPSWDAGQLAKEQAQRLYNQQLQRQLPQQQQPHHGHQRAALPHDLNGMSGYDDSLNAFGWEGPPANHPMQQYSAAQFSRNAASHQSRPQQQPKLARQAFSSELRHKDIGSSDLASAMSLPTSSGTEGRVGAEGGPRGPNKRKGGRSRKAPPSDSQAMQRCLDVVEQLLEEEDAEPFAEPVDAAALGLHDYHDVIRQPMDLGTIKENLMAEPPSYFSPAEVLKDVQQVWANCRTYNDEEEPIIDMCDNMERFFYQAWKEGGLPLPHGAGPALSRVRSTGPKGHPSSAWDADQQPARGHRHQHADQLQDDDDDDHAEAPAAQSVFSLTEGGHHKRRKGMPMNPTSAGTASSHREGPSGSKKKSAAASAAEPSEPPIQVQLSAQEQEAEKADRGAVAAWESLQKQRQKAQQVIQAAQDAVRKLTEAQAALDDIHKAAVAQEAAQAAAEALHSWPSDARLVPSTYPAYPPAAPQILHPEVAQLGSYIFALPGGIPPSTQAEGSRYGGVTTDNDAEAHHSSLSGVDDESGPKGNEDVSGETDEQQEKQQGSQRQKQEHIEQGGPQLTGWQRRLQTGLSPQLLNQIVAGQSVQWGADAHHG